MASALFRVVGVGLGLEAAPRGHPLWFEILRYRMRRLLAIPSD